MMKQFSLTTTINQAAPIFGAAALTGLAIFGMPGVAQAFSIGPGKDRFMTAESGAVWDFGDDIGEVTFIGNPPNGTKADTIIKRLSGVDDDPSTTDITDTTDLQVHTLSLKSKEEVEFNGLFYNVFVTKDPDKADDIHGEMMFYENPDDPGSIKTKSELSVYWQAEFIEVGGSDSFITKGVTELPGIGTWKDGDGDRKGKFVLKEQKHTGPHPVIPVPEPLTTLASVTGLAFGGILKRKNDKKNKKQQKA